VCTGTKDERLLTAIHESGHAVINWLLDLPFEFVVLEAQAQAGRAHIGEKTKIWGGEALTLRYVTSCVAGDAAVELITGNRDPHSAGDYANATHAMRGEITERALAMRQAYQVADALLRGNVGALVAVSQELLTRGRLSYQEVAEICSAHTLRRQQSRAIPSAT
jgi:hypothetical protein